MAAILSWMGSKALFGLARWMWGGIALAALVGAFLWLQAREKADDKANQEIGATVQREGDLRETLKRTEQGNDAKEEIKREADAGNGAALYDQCLRGNRGGAENCQRFLPERPAGDGER